MDIKLFMVHLLLVFLNLFLTIMSANSGNIGASIFWCVSTLCWMIVAIMDVVNK